MEFVKLAVYIAMFIISMVQMTRSKKKPSQNTDTPSTASPAATKPARSRQRAATDNAAASTNNSEQKRPTTNRSRRPKKRVAASSSPSRQPEAAADSQQMTARIAAATDDQSESISSRPIPGFAAFTGFPVLVGLVGACGSWLFHGREATAVGVMAGAATGFFAAIMYTLYHSTNHPDWEAPTDQQRPVSLFAARAIPTGAAGGMFLGWMIPARGNWEVYFAPFVLTLFGVLAAMFISLLHEAAERRRTTGQS
ncbi:MAG: hypothetical protein NXI04_29760 [Planctomycetaceae bacterium]|nr:hypothetical protein [Planctomycetaceae bacterium]